MLADCDILKLEDCSDLYRYEVAHIGQAVGRLQGSEKRVQNRSRIRTREFGPTEQDIVLFLLTTETPSFS